jgi:DNA-binding YbaB/EbfC family protein
MAAEDDEAGTGGLGDLFAQFEQAQERIETAAAEASGTIVEGSAADGRVVVRLRGDLDAVSVHIDPSVVDAGDVGLLEDLLLAAIRDGLTQIAELQEQVAGAFAGGAGGLDVGSLLGSLGNLPGLAELGNLGNLPGFEAGAVGQLPELEGLDAIFPETGDSPARDDEDGDREDGPSFQSSAGLGGARGPAAGGGAGSGGPGSSHEGTDGGDDGPSGLG